jgi:hypothetical protein
MKTVHSKVSEMPTAPPARELPTEPPASELPTEREPVRYWPG